jgi:hypothetical protein
MKSHQRMLQSVVLEMRTLSIVYLSQCNGLNLKTETCSVQNIETMDKNYKNDKTTESAIFSVITVSFPTVSRKEIHQKLFKAMLLVSHQFNSTVSSREFCL